MQTFFLVCPIGLENSVKLELELKNILPLLGSVKALKGGLEVTCAMETGLGLNLALRTPTRILMRLKTQRCRDYPKLFNIVSKLPWGFYLCQEDAQWRISTSKSRIINTDKARETCEKALKKHFSGQPLSKRRRKEGQDRPLQKIFLRIENDDLTISLDTSGELLHIRGGRPDRGKASLRENYAACLLALFTQGAAGPQLVDPMCGTGTFLIEALNFFRPHPRGSFPFEVWKVAKAKEIEIPDRELALEFAGMDIEPKISNPAVEVRQRDVFSPLPPNLKNKYQGCAVICNPPYGKRIKIQGNRKKYFLDLVEKIKNDFAPEMLGMIIPADVNVTFGQVYTFNNNGIKVNFCVQKKEKGLANSK